jgi:hypothetical protein
MFASQVQEWNSDKSSAEQAQLALTSCLQFAIKFRDASGGQFRTEPMPGLGYTIPEAITYAQRALRVFEAIDFDRNSLVARGFWSNAHAAVHDILAAANSLQAQALLVNDEKRPLALSGSSVVNLIETAAAIADFGGPAQALTAATDRLADACAVLASLVSASRRARTAQASELIKGDAEASVAALTISEEAAKTATAAREAAIASATEANALKDQAEAALAASKEAISAQETAVQEALSQLTSASASAAEHATLTQTKLDDVTRLTAQAGTYHTELTTYAATLDATEKRVKAIEDRAGATVSAMDQQRGQVASLLTEAERMVSGATVAGLAKAFADERTSLESSMRAAYVGFVVGIVLLALFSTVIAAYVLNIPVSILGLHIPAQARGASGYEVTIAGIISRALILVAPFWLTLFSARRYRSLFDLRQQYSHKYNMAFSMEGFKNQAPEYKEAIAAWVFQIVAANPLLQKPGTAMDEPPPTAVNELISGATSALGRVLRPG